MLLLGSVAFATTILRYYLFTPSSKWSHTLADLSANAFTVIGIAIHFTAGVLVLVLGPVLVLGARYGRSITALRAASEHEVEMEEPKSSEVAAKEGTPVVTRRGLWATIHRRAGAVFAVCALATCLGGIVFVIAHPNGTVGRASMSVPFVMYGVVWAIVTSVAWYASAVSHNYVLHKRFALHSFGLGIASLQYRLLYAIAALGFGYVTPTGPEDPEMQTADFNRPLDIAFNWLFWTPNLLFVELVWLPLDRRNYTRSKEVVRGILVFVTLIAAVALCLAYWGGEFEPEVEGRNPDGTFRDTAVRALAALQRRTRARTTTD
jgi:hypothetical protein